MASSWDGNVKLANWIYYDSHYGYGSTLNMGIGALPLSYLNDKTRQKYEVGIEIDPICTDPRFCFRVYAGTYWGSRETFDRKMELAWQIFWKVWYAPSNAVITRDYNVLGQIYNLLANFQARRLSQPACILRKSGV